MDEPDAAAYGRVTDADRFRALHGVAEELIDRLRSAYDVEVDHPVAAHTGHDVLSVTRLRPTAAGAASLTFELTGFPGVILRAGARFTAAHPACGCDACDEQPDQLAAELRDAVDAIVHGRFEERQGPTGDGFTVWGDQGERSGWSRREVPSPRRPRVHRWDPWPTRPSSAAG